MTTITDAYHDGLCCKRLITVSTYYPSSYVTYTEDVQPTPLTSTLITNTYVGTPIKRQLLTPMSIMTPITTPTKLTCQVQRQQQRCLHANYAPLHRRQ